MKNTLPKNTSARVTQTAVTEEEVREIVIDVSSEELIPVVGAEYSQSQLYDAIQGNSL